MEVFLFLWYSYFFLITVLFLCFFFFQAEDGIRDIGVTGVQTCALPISPAAADEDGRHEQRPQGREQGDDAGHAVGLAAPDDPLEQASVLVRDVERGVRSEERRVGKECRSRWSPYH